MRDPEAVAELVAHFSGSPGGHVLKAQTYDGGAPSSPQADGLGDARSSAKVRRLMFDPELASALRRWDEVVATLGRLEVLEQRAVALYYTPHRLEHVPAELRARLGSLVLLAGLVSTHTVAELVGHPSRVDVVEVKAAALVDRAVLAYAWHRRERERAKVRRRRELLEAETSRMLAEEVEAIRRKLWGSK